MAIAHTATPHASTDPVDEALQNSASSLRSPRMFDADDTSWLFEDLLVVASAALAAEPVQEAASSTIRARPITILLAEDNPTNAYITTE